MQFNGDSLFFAFEERVGVWGAEGEVEGGEERSFGVEEV